MSSALPFPQIEVASARMPYLDDKIVASCVGYAFFRESSLALRILEPVPEVVESPTHAILARPPPALARTRALRHFGKPLVTGSGGAGGCAGTTGADAPPPPHAINVGGTPIEMRARNACRRFIATFERVLFAPPGKLSNLPQFKAIVGKYDFCQCISPFSLMNA